MLISVSHCLRLRMLFIENVVIFVVLVCDVLVSSCFYVLFNLIFILSASVFTFIFYIVCLCDV